VKRDFSKKVLFILCILSVSIIILSVINFLKSPYMIGQAISRSGAFNLISPSSGATQILLTPTLQWSSSFGVSSYTLQVSTDATFSSLSYEKTLISKKTTSFTLPPGFLSSSVLYYWKVVAMNSNGQIIASNAPYSFTTLTVGGASDTTPPIVTTSNSPAIPSSMQAVVYTATASDSSGIYQIQIFVNNDNSGFALKQTCSLTTSCIYTEGPYSANTIHSYYAVAFDNSPSHNQKVSIINNFTVINSNLNQTNKTRWVSAYYAAWSQYNKYPLQPSMIDYGAFTHLMHFAVIPTGGPNFDGTVNGMTPDNIQQTVQYTHAAGKKIILTIGGWGANFTSAISPTNRAQFITNLINYMQTYGYDGLDIDWEPVTDAANFKIFIPQLKSAMLAANPNWVLTAAAYNFDPAIVENAQYFDQINLMTYDMSGPWPGWVVWHNSPIYNGGQTFPSTGGLLPATDDSINRYINAGVPKQKLGIGIDFYGYYWNGVNQPLQDISTVTSYRGNVPYSEIMDTYPTMPRSWDNTAQSSYIKIDNSGTTNDMFVSIDDENTISAKFNYIKTKDVGGLIIWELGGGYRGNMPQGQRDPLLQAVKTAFLDLPPPVLDSIIPTATITSPISGATIFNTTIITATANDNVAVSGVQFKIDGINIGNEVSAPYTLNLNTLSYSNGQHTLQAVARDTSHNLGYSSLFIVNINNQAQVPNNSDIIVFDDTTNPQFSDASWSAVNSLNTNPSYIKKGSASLKVDYAAWGGLDFLYGTWAQTYNIDPKVYDRLRFDVYPTSAFDLTIGFYTGYQKTVSLIPNQWNSIEISLTPTTPFNRFFMQQQTGASTTAYFDNIRFVHIGNS
jgi:chitinase